MWILRPSTDFKSRSSSCYHSNFVWKDENLPIYIMDNHLSAAWCWMQECQAVCHYNFFHIDRHHDLSAIGDVDVLDGLRGEKVEYNEYKNLMYDNRGQWLLFRWDNYIRNAHYLYPNWFHTNLFYIQQWPTDDPLGSRFPEFTPQMRDPLLIRQELTQYVEEPSPYLADGFLESNVWQYKWILNIDLDFIWDENHVRIFDDEFIADLGQRIKNAMSNIQVVTIALSPECVGGKTLEEQWNNSLKVLKLLTDALGIEFFKESVYK